MDPERVDCSVSVAMVGKGASRSAVVVMANSLGKEGQVMLRTAKVDAGSTIVSSE